MKCFLTFMRHQFCLICLSMDDPNKRVRAAATPHLAAEPALTRSARLRSVDPEGSQPAIRFSYWSAGKTAFREWRTGDSFQMGAALAYYAVFSIGPMVLLLVAMASLVLGEQAAKGKLFAHLAETMGQEVAVAVQPMLIAAYRPTTGKIATVIGVITLLFVATGFFSQLRFSLNHIFGTNSPKVAAWKVFLRRRVAAFLMILALGITLLVSLAADTLVSSLGAEFTRWINLPVWVFSIISLTVSFALLTGVLLILFKFLPDNDLGMRSLLIGAAVSSVLFSIGRVLIGLYLGRMSTASVYGAAGSVIILLLAAFYFSQILFFGAYLAKACSHVGKSSGAALRALGVTSFLLLAPLSAHSSPPGAVPVFARAQFKSMGGSQVTGLIEFAKHPDGGLVVEAEVANAMPGAHGLHIHDGKDCVTPGGHFNPTKSIHGKPSTRLSHVGDIGNLLTVMDGSGVLRTILWNRGGRSFGGWNAIIGKPVVFHRRRDNFHSQPHGDSGPPIACGMIEPAQKEFLVQ